MDAEVIKILLVGDEKCGKTTFLSRLTVGENVNPIPILRDIDQPFIFEIKSKNKSYRFEFCDTSCPDNWQTLDPDAIVICYDISQRLSLINIQRYWLPEAKKIFARIDTLPVIVLGLKRDLRSEKDPNGIIYPQEAYQTAQAMRADRYVECSAVTGELLQLAFQDLCQTAMKPLQGAPDSEGLMAVGCSVM